MTNRNPLIRAAMTAIAAAIACSTPSFAQSADPPVTESPAPVEAAPVAPAPVAPAPVTPEPIVPDTPPVAETPAPPEEVAAPAARRAPATRATPPSVRPAPARAARAAPAAAAAPAPAAAGAAPVAEAPAVAPLPVPPEAAPVAAPAAAENENATNDLLPALAAGALAIVALAGFALMLRRRKRHAAEADELALRDAQLAAIDDAEPAMIVEPEPEPVPQADPVKPAFVAAPALATAPVVAAAPVADPTPDVDGPVTELPEDFDLSRFGYNVQEAYKGPTEDNPSLSMKNRLTRARGMDQLERNLDAEVEAATGEPVLTEAEMNPPAEASAAEAPAADRAVDAANGDIPPSGSDQKPAMRPDVPN